MWAHVVVRLVWECLLLLVLLNLPLVVGAGFSDDVSHILVWEGATVVGPRDGKRA